MSAQPAEFAARPRQQATPDRSIDDLDAAIVRAARNLNAETYRMLVLVREFDDRFGFAKWSFRTCAEWLSWRCQLSLSAAREQVRTAQALRRLPAISAAFEKGRLSYSKVRALTRVAHEHDEDLLLAYALDATAAQVEERCRQMRNVGPESADAARLVWERRSLSVIRNPGRGTLTIIVEMPVEEGEVVVRALDCAVEQGEVAVGADLGAARGLGGEAPGDGWRAQQADALLAVAKAYLAEPAESGTPRASVADHYQIVVHVDEKSLRGGPGRSDVPLETVRRLACDGNLIALVEDEAGTPLGLGRKRRVVSTGLRRALWSRDRGCTFPGCYRTHYVDAHHVRHWIDGGTTDPANLTLLCSYHHRLLHEGGFSIRTLPGGTLEFLRADGRAIPRGGYRLEHMADDMVDSAAGDAAPSAEGSCTDREQCMEVHEPRAVYRLAPLNTQCRVSAGRRRARPMARIPDRPLIPLAGQ